LPDPDQVNGIPDTNMSATQQHFGLATLDWQGRPAAALYTAGMYWPLQRLGLPDASVVSLFSDWDAVFPQLQRQAVACASGVVPAHIGVSRDDAVVLTPLHYPNKIVGIAFNYRSALIEAGMPPVAWDPLPLFSRPSSNSLVGPTEAVHMSVGDGLDWEVELGVIMGRRMRNVSAEEGMRAIAGYAVCVDLTVRDLLMVNTPFKTDIFRTKCQDGLSPIGPTVTPAAFVPDPHNLRMRLSVNGVAKQDSNSSDMLVRIGDLISEVSRYMTWEPGDLLLTGTPAGIGRFNGPYLKAGDTVRAQIEGLEACEFEVLERLSDPPASPR
jgi:2-keto-4-pentenoate hydratase/2-oxohepta-3-ene-1,7-dioic acid hydratase in catechol pathway